MEILVYSTINNFINLFNLKTNKLINKLINNSIIWCYDFSYDGRIIVYGDNNGYHSIYNIIENKLISKNIFYDNSLISIACTNIVDKIILGYIDGVLIVFNNLSKTFKKIKAHNETIQTINICETKNILITTSFNCEIKIWDLTTVKLLKHIKQNMESWIIKLEISIENNCFIYFDTVNDVKMYSLSNYQKIKTFLIPNLDLTDFIIKNNKFIYSTSNYNIVELDLKTSQFIKEEKQKNKYIESFFYSDNNKLAYCNNLNEIIYNHNIIIQDKVTSIF